MAWQPVFDQLFPTDQWYVASDPLQNSYARLTWVDPNQTERYGVAILTSAGEIYGNQVIRASSQPQIIRLPTPIELLAPVEANPFYLAIRPWNLAAFALPLKVEVIGEVENTPFFSELEQVDPIDDDQLLLWRDSQPKRVLFSSLEPETQLINKSKQCTWSANGDANGLFYWLGTKYETRAFINPALAAICNASSNNILTNDVTNAFNATGRSSSYYSSATNATSFWQVDLGETGLLKLNRYAIQSRQDALLNTPRNWILEGSNAGDFWTQLDSKANNAETNAIGQWASWGITTNRFFRFFRIRLAGTNNSGNNVLAFSEVEFYGDFTKD